MVPGDDVSFFPAVAKGARGLTKKYGRVEARADRVRDVFFDVETWPRWMPGIERAAVLERTDEMTVMFVEQRYWGRRFSQEVECRFRSDGLDQHQRSGFFDRWEARWRIRPAPGGRGATFICEYDAELGGIAGLLITRRKLHLLFDQIFQGIVNGLEEEIRRRDIEYSSTAAETLREEILLQVFETGGELEVWLEGEKCGRR